MMNISKYIDEYGFNRPVETIIKIDNRFYDTRKNFDLKALLIGEPIFLGDNFDEVVFIKESLITADGSICEIKTEPGRLYLDNIYKDYLESILEYEMPHDQYATFYATEGMDFEEIKKNGWLVKYNLDFNIPSYEGFINNLSDYMDFIKSLNKR